ncbi:MAG: MmcQ/YjbR family DNA-binding protein [Bryobacterales bacterium]|nr:MmcQ/YjbR family DNA-binding protein [Bryobacterales bacterium]MBV9399746.1 MmcQ/YjbR family DNA-binding protein [Bryobacterales bacterium]
MSTDWIRTHCLSLPHTTEQMQWGDDLVFKIGGKMYAVMPLIPMPVKLAFKCTPEDFSELTERPGVIPAPYIARAQWVALESLDALPRAEIQRLLSKSYELVFAKLTKKLQAELQRPASTPPKKAKARA